MKTTVDVPLSLKLFIFLMQHRGVKFSAENLANTFECSMRSIYRHIDTLTIAGIPVELQRGRNGGIWLSQSYKFS